MSCKKCWKASHGSRRIAILGDEHVVRQPLPPVRSAPSPSSPAAATLARTRRLCRRDVERAVCGEVFTSPSTDAVLAAIRASAGPGDALLIVKNYTGDRLTSPPNSRAPKAFRRDGHRRRRRVAAGRVERGQRRGIAGTVLIQLAGAAAARGCPRPRPRPSRATRRPIGTMGVALDGCTIPGADKAGFSLGDHEIGSASASMARKASNVAHRCRPMRWSTLLSSIVADLVLDRGERVALFVNGLGATPDMARDRARAHDNHRRGLVVARARPARSCRR